MKIFVYYNNLGPSILMVNIGASPFQFTPSGCPSRRTRRKGGPTGTQGILYRRMYWPNCPGWHLMLTVVSTPFHLKEQLQWLPPSPVLWSLLNHSSVCALLKNSSTSRWEVFVAAPILIDFGFWEQLMDWSNIMELKGILSKKFIEPFIPTFLQWFWPRGIFAGGWLAHYKRLMQICVVLIQSITFIILLWILLKVSLSSDVWYNTKQFRWEMAVTGKKEKTFAVSDNSLSSLLLGRSGWIIEEDNFGREL